MMNKTASFEYSQSKPSTFKKNKSNAKNIAIQAYTQLGHYYSNSSHTSSIEQISQRVMQLSGSIFESILQLNKEVVNLAFLFNNNIALANILNNISMAAAFTYLAGAYIKNGIHFLVQTYKQLMVNLKSYSLLKNSSDFGKKAPGYFTEVEILCKNLNFLFDEHKSEVNPKSQRIAHNVVYKFTRSIQSNGSKSFDWQSRFYLPCFQYISQSKSKAYLFKQLLRSYLRYVCIQKIVPALDVCKLLSDALHKNVTKDCISNIFDSQAHVDWKLIDSDINVNIVQRCFYIMGMHCQVSSFVIVDDVLKQTVEKCYETEPYCNNSPAIIDIFKNLFKIKKIHLFTNPEQWKQQTSSPSIKDTCLFLSSVYLFLQNCQLSLKSSSSAFQSDMLLNAEQLYRFLKNNLDELMNGEGIHLIWENIVRVLNQIKMEMTQMVYRRKILQNRSNILKYSKFIQIQTLIFSNKQFRLLTNNIYCEQQIPNNYIHILTQLLCQQPQSFTNKLLPRRSHKYDTQQCKQICKKMNSNICTSSFQHWDEAIYNAAGLIDVCGDVLKLNKVAGVLEELIKCRGNTLFAHNILQSSQRNGKILEMNGIRLLLQVISKNSDKKAKHQDELILTSSLQYDQNISQSKSVSLESALKREKIRVKSHLLFSIYKEIISPLVQKWELIYASEDLLNPPPIQSILAFLFSATPQLLNQFNCEETLSVKKIQSQAIQIINQRTFDKCRHAYHKTVSYLIQDYNFATESQKILNKENHHVGRDTLWQKKVMIQTYLKNYKNLFPDNQNSSINNEKLRRSVGRRSSFFRKSDYSCISTSPKCPQESPKTICNRLLFIDFFVWVIHTSQKRELPQIKSQAYQILSQYIDKLSLQEYLLNMVTTLTSENIPDIQLIAQCYNKLMYLTINNSFAQSIQVSHQQGNKKDDQESNEWESKENNKLNKQFEFQEMGLSIDHLSKYITQLSNICLSILNQLFPTTPTSPPILFQLFSQIQSPTKKFYSNYKQIRNPQRLLVCLNNIIGICYNIGYQWNQNDIGVLASLCLYKLVLIYVSSGSWFFWFCFAQMIFLGYTPNLQQYVQQLKAKVEEFDSCYDEQKTIRKGEEKNEVVVLQNMIVSLIKLYMNWDPNPSSFSENSLNSHVLKLIFFLQNISHINPHKTVLKSCTSYIFTKNFSTESSLIKYNISLLPFTELALQINGTTLDMKIKSLIEQSSGQVQHRLLELYLSRSLSCYLIQGQLSQFRHYLTISLLYFMRSCNVRGSLLSLRCYQSRTKHPQYYTIDSPIQEQPQSEVFLPLDMLSLSDSFGCILSKIFPNNFNKNKFDKFCNILLGKGNRRTSRSFHTPVEDMYRNLFEGIGKCGQIAANIFLILGQHLCKMFQNRKEWMFYIGHLKIYQPQSGNRSHKKTNLSSLKDTQIKTNFDQKLLHFWNELQNQQSFKPTQYIFLSLIKEFLPLSFEHASIVQNMFHNTIEAEEILEEENILQLSLVMLDHNYLYKRMIESVESINIGEKNYAVYLKSIDQANKKYAAFYNSWHQKCESKLDFLKDGRMNYPMTIVYPFGEKVYMISASSPLTVTNIQRHLFQDDVNTVDLLISKNRKLLFTKNMQNNQWWKSRDEVNRAIEKTINKSNLCLWDIHSSQQLTEFYQTYNSNERKICKIIAAVLRASVKNSGKVWEILERTNLSLNNKFIESVISEITKILKSAEQFSKLKEGSQQNLLILTNSQYFQYPFESSSQLRDRYVYRIPSVEYIIEQQSISCSKKEQYPKTINIEKTKFLVNSNNDLLDTEQVFMRIKQNYPTWSGITGRKPQFLEFFKLLDQQCFLYMGHGSGSIHIRQKLFHMQTIQCYMMLFGCSSANVIHGKCEPHGITFSHLINGASGVLGCLWDVTDKDTDKITESVFGLVNDRPQNLAKLVKKAKQKCKSKYLNAGAVVLMGLPVYVYRR